MKPSRRLDTKPGPRSSLRAGRTRLPLARMMRIDEVVRANRFPNCTVLARELEVDRKTVLRDISCMRDDWGLPLEYHAVEHGYYYTRPVRDLPVMRLQRQDVLALFLARRALEPLEGTRVHAAMAESLSRIAAMCPGEVSLGWEDVAGAFSVWCAGTLTSDLAEFGALLDAVVKQRVLEFDYVKLNGGKKERRMVHAYHVGQIEHGWYVVGYDVRRRGMRTFAMPRMTDLVVRKTRFTRPADFDVREHFGGSFGVWAYEERGRSRHEVRIEFTGYAARVVSERRWHASQEVVALRGGAVELRMRLAGLEEVTRWVLSWGGKARVLGPTELRERVAREVLSMRRQANLT